MSAAFYDELAEDYHLLYSDWEAAISRQGAAIAALLHEAGVEPGARVLDAACGIGTQALGLLQHGYRVIASDASAGAVARFKSELAARALQAEVRVDDMRVLSTIEPESVSAVIACDNSIPHGATTCCFNQC